MIYAFRATLRDIKNSNLILLVLDASENMRKILEKRKVCEETLAQIKANNIPMIHILNKIDRIGKKEINKRKELLQNSVGVSGLYRIGLGGLKRKIKCSLHT